MKRDQTLERLQRLLTSAGPLTATQIAKRTRCSKPTVYARLLELQRRGVDVRSVVPERASKPGPAAREFFIHDLTLTP